MPVRSFNRDFILEVLDEDHDDAELIKDILDETDTKGHNLLRTMIFLYDDKHYRCEYSEGISTGRINFNTPGDEIECQEVEPFDRIITDYRPVEDRKDNDQRIRFSDADREEIYSHAMKISEKTLRGEYDDDDL